MNKKKYKKILDTGLTAHLQPASLKMASRNRLLPVWGSHLGNTRGWERDTFFATGQKFKDFQSCLPNLPAYFPLKFPYGQLPLKIPGPVSQTKLKTKKNSKKLWRRCGFNKKPLLIN